MFGEGPAATIIISFNTRALLLEAVASAVETLADDPRSEIIVVDNASDDGSFDAVRDNFPQVRAIRNDRNIGFGAACNQAVKMTTAAILLLLNSDARINRGALDAMLICMGNASCGLAGCSIMDDDGNRVGNGRNFLSPTNQALELLGIARGTRWGRSRPLLETDVRDCSIDWIEGSCLLIRKKAFDQVGGFDERFFMYSEDEDLCLSLKKWGWTVCLTAAGAAIHHGGASAKRDAVAMQVEFYRSQLLFLDKHRGLIGVAIFKVMMKMVLGLKAWCGPEERRPQSRERLKSFRLACLSELQAGDQ